MNDSFSKMRFTDNRRFIRSTHSQSKSSFQKIYRNSFQPFINSIFQNNKSHTIRSQKWRPSFIQQLKSTHTSKLLHFCVKWHSFKTSVTKTYILGQSRVHSFVHRRNRYTSPKTPGDKSETRLLHVLLDFPGTNIKVPWFFGRSS